MGGPPFRPRSSAGAATVFVSLALAMTLLASGCGLFDGGDDEAGGTEAGDGEGGDNGDLPEELLAVALDQVPDEDLHVVSPGEDLPGILEARCGSASPALIDKVAADNRNRLQEDGGYLEDPFDLQPDWILLISCDEPEIPLIACPETADTLYLGQGDEARVAICLTSGRAEYFGQRLSDRASIVLPACRRFDGAVGGINRGSVTTTHYLVDTGPAGSVDIYNTPAGDEATTGTLAASFALTRQSAAEDPASEVARCEGVDPTFVEDDLAYEVHPAPVTTLGVPGSWSSPPPPDPENCFSTGTLNATYWPPLDQLPEPGQPPIWVTVHQAEVLRLGAPPAGLTATMEGGGLSWPLTPGVLGGVGLTITDAQPLGRYAVYRSDSDEPVARVEVVRQPVATVRRDEGASGGAFKVARIYGLRGNEVVGVLALVDEQCTSVWTPVISEEMTTSVEGVAKVDIDLGSAPTDRTFCLALGRSAGSLHCTGFTFERR